MSALDQETEVKLRKVKTRILVGRVVATLASVGWVGAFAYYEFVLALLSRGSKATSYTYEGILFLVPSTLSALALWHISRMQSAVARKDIIRLKKLNSLGWAVVALVVSGVVPGVMMFVSRGLIGELTPPQFSSDALMDVIHMKKFFHVRQTFVQSLARTSEEFVHAVDDVSFRIAKGEIFGLAGESGSGKTTVLRTAMMLTPPTSGSIIFKGVDISSVEKGDLKKLRLKMQVVFQDPYESVNPRMPVFDIVAEGLFVNNLVSSRAEAEERVMKALQEVQITPPEEYLYRYPHELSGGQRQRVAIARALILDPDLILADEPVSMLDVSIRAEVINVLLSIREKRGISVLMVTHDLALSKDMVDRLAIMYVGKIVEQGPAEDVVAAPYHPYTHALTAAVPVPDPRAPKVRVLAKGEIPTNISPPPGCRFNPRCPFARAVCTEEEPPLEEVSPGRLVACHFWKETHEAFARGLDGPVGTVATN